MAAVDRLVAQAQSDFGSDWGIHVEYKWIYKVLNIERGRKVSASIRSVSEELVDRCK